MTSKNTYNDHPRAASEQAEPSHIAETLIDDDEFHDPVEDLKPAPSVDAAAAAAAEDSTQPSSEMRHYLYFDDNDCFFATHFS